MGNVPHPRIFGMSPLLPENEERNYMQAIGFEHFHRTTDKYHFCLSDIGENLGIDNESFMGTNLGMSLGRDMEKILRHSVASIFLAEWMGNMEKWDVSEMR